MGIYSKIIDLQKLGQAWEKVKRNKPACGVDNITYEIFEERKREELRQLNLELLEHRYESLPVRLHHIYKGEKVRTIALFTMRDKIVQQSFASELSRIYEPLFSKTAYAYRAGRSALEALQKIEEKIEKHEKLWVLKIDIADFFDSIPHELLEKTLAIKIREADVLQLLRTILKASVLDERSGKLTEKRRGIYQGSSCAPVLSNIFLMDYDQEMEKRCGFYMRYSDDILILEKNEDTAQKLLEYSCHYLNQKGLDIKKEKLQMHCLTEQEGFTYLGYRFTSVGKFIPAKAVSSLTSSLESMWLTSGLEISDKIKKGQEILRGWEQYYRGERKPDSIIEYALLLSMVRNKPTEIKKKIESQRFQVVNHYRDIADYLAAYWSGEGNLQYALREYEEFCQVPDKENSAAHVTDKILQELLLCYSNLLIQPSEELYTEIMQLYTDFGEYKKAAHFWEMKTKYLQERSSLEEVPLPSDTAEGKRNAEEAQINIQTYMELFAGREDLYVKERIENGQKRAVEQILEPLTEEAIKQHLSGEIVLGTYVQRPNSTVKYMVLDVDVSKKILLQYSYGSPEFAVYKQKASVYAQRLCRILKKMGLTGYLEDTGFRGYHVWVFFAEWIPVRYLNQLTDCVEKEVGNIEDNIAIEFFPNKGRIRPGKNGQSIKLPLGIHIRTGERSFFLNENLEIVSDYKKFFSETEKAALSSIQKILGTYSLDMGKKTETRETDRNLECFEPLSESVKIVLERCALLRYLCQKAAATGYLTHFERMSVLYVFGHMGDEGKEFVHTVMGFTLNYQYAVTQKFIAKLPEKPISCVKLREQYKLISAEFGCSCNFKRTKNCYPSPVLHAIKDSGEERMGITLPISRTLPKTKEEKVYEEINIHKQTEKLAQKIVEQKRQKRGLNKSIRKLELELQKIFDNAGIDCLEIEMGMLIRRKKGEEYEWLIEL